MYNVFMILVVHIQIIYVYFLVNNQIQQTARKQNEVQLNHKELKNKKEEKRKEEKKKLEKTTPKQTTKRYKTKPSHSVLCPLKATLISNNMSECPADSHSKLDHIPFFQFFTPLTFKVGQVHPNWYKYAIDLHCLKFQDFT